MKLSKLAVPTLGGLLVSTTLIAGTVKPINDPHYLFIQNAKTATVKAVKNKPGTYQVTMKNTKDNVLYFARRPVRKAGHVPVQSFINEWGPDKYGHSVAPNAGLTGRVNKKSVTVALVLKKPAYNAKDNTLVYTATLLGKQQKNPCLFETKTCVIVNRFNLRNLCWFLKKQ